MLATSLRGAALALVAALALPASALAHKSSGAVAPNTGAPGSACVGVPFPGRDAGPDPSLDTTSLGPTAPAPYELGRPTSTPEKSQPVQRVMMLVHGGGWYMVGASAMRTERREASAWRAAGWETVSVSYPACRGSLLGVLTFYDLVRGQVGNDVPICLEGQSAGAQLALLTAAMRPDVACVIAAGAPTDIRSLAAEGAREAAAGAPAPGLKKGSLLAQNLAKAAFGRQATGRRNPIGWAGQIQARVLLATAVNDPMIPAEQASDLASAIQAARPGAYVDVDRLAPGSISWVHGTVSQEALNDLSDRMTKLVEPFARRPTSAPPPTGLLGLLNGLLPGFL